MGSVTDKAGQSYPLKKSLRKALASLAIATALASFAWLGTAAPLEAGGDTRSISMFQVHTKESINITYMQNGRYVPSAMKKINYFLRDWRRNATVTIDPRTLDLMWELHADLGSNRPIHIVCGFRSGKTNAFLKRKGRNVAKKSQHVKGKAIDFYFPDVPTVKIRNSALVRRIGGVGYYRSSGGPTGFLHVDTGNVRHWGPAISKSQWASIFREGKKTLGRRKSRGDSEIAVASAEGETQSKKGIFGWFGGKKKNAAPDPAPIPQVAEEEIEAPNYTGFDEDLAELASDVSAEPKQKAKAKVVAPEVVAEVAPKVEETPVVAVRQKKPSSSLANADLASLTQSAATEQLGETQVEEAAGEAPVEVKRGYPIPKPRFKPAGIATLAMADVTKVVIEPASAAPDSAKFSIAAKPKVLAAEVAPARLRVIENDTIVASTLDENQVTVKTGKSDFAAEIRAGETMDVPLIRPVVADAKTSEKSDIVIASLVTLDLTQLTRRNGRPVALDATEESVLPQAAVLDDAPTSEVEGKGDVQVVNREGKGNLQPIASNLKGVKLGALVE